METTLSKSTKMLVMALLVVEAITVTVPVIILGKYFHFPDILRQPAQEAFALFRNNQLPIVIGYYIFLLSSLLYVPLSYTIRQLYNQSINIKGWLQVFTGLGIATTVFQSIGFARWIFTMPFLTQTYFAYPESKQTVTLIYEMLNRYAGMSIGEHLGFIAMGCWTIVFGIIIIKKTNPSKSQGFISCLIGLLLIVSVGEHFGGSTAALFGAMNFIANTLWTCWLLTIAISISLTKNN